MKEPNYFIPDRSFSVFGFDIYYYAVCIVCGIILATIVCAILFKRRNLPTDWVIDLLLCILPLGIIGARTFFCLTDPGTSITEWFTKFRDGGLSIIGGVCGGVIVPPDVDYFRNMRLPKRLKQTRFIAVPIGIIEMCVCIDNHNDSIVFFF